MKKRLNILPAVIIFLLAFPAISQTTDKKKTSKKMEKDKVKIEKVELTGTIYKEQFINKAGKKIEGAFTIYFKHESKSYFIKGCECKLEGKKLQDYVGMTVKATVKIKNGLWDVCEGNKNAQSRTGEYVAIYSIEVIKDLNTYAYADGSGNVYEFTKDSIEYIPVKKENSSSGEYSGGTPVKMAISAAQFEIVKTMFKGIENDKTIHIENREMMTGMIRTTYEEVSQVTLFSKGDRMALLENTLKFILKK